jgi:glutamate N-acetyltransferase/amino-acid N-acetyltransferase
VTDDLLAVAAASAADRLPLDPLDEVPSGLPAVVREPTVPGGFRAGGAAVGIKRSGKPDLALVVATGRPAAAAAVFTTNAFAAAPVRRSRANLAASMPSGGGGYGVARVVVSTSGSANAATGPSGDVDQATICEAVARAVGCEPSHVLALSTGLIGTRLPVSLVTAGVADLAERLPAGAVGMQDAARALMTTDARPKWSTARIALPRPDRTAAEVTIAGIAKGVGMIHPRMATMLAIIITDAAAEPAALHAILRRVASRTWDQLTVDGDTSTNDTVFLLASGASGAADPESGSPEERLLETGVEAVARDLARQQAADGEGATTLVVCQATGAADDVDARAAARAVIASSLVKAAVHGRDPNWGRIAAAVGSARLPDAAVLEAAGLDSVAARDRAGSPVRVVPERTRIAIAGTDVFAGVPLAFDAQALRAVMDAPEVLIRIDLGLGSGRGEAFGCDLTEAYVVENSAYST